MRGPATLYSFDDKLTAVTEGSLIRFPKKDRDDFGKHAEVTHIYETTVDAILAEDGSEHYRAQLQRNAGREIANSDTVTVYELHEVMLPSRGDHLSYMNTDID